MLTAPITGSATPLERTLHGRFLRGLAAGPDRPAFRTPEREVTYAEAHATALAWAGALLAAAPLPPRAVGVLATKSEEAYIGLLAALYLGAAAVPLHPDFPAGRTLDALRAAGVDALIADRRGAAALGPLEAGLAGLPVLAPDGAGTILPGAAPLDAPLPVAAESTAYVLFTSGSTGRPKGVPVTHRAADSYFTTLEARYRFGPDDVFSQTFDLTFDCAVFDLFCAWGAGGCVVPLPLSAYRELPKFIAEQRMTVWFATPGSIALARRTGALAPGSLGGLRWSLFAGEPLYRADAEEWLLAAPDSVLENLYGPTELTVTVTAHRYHPETPEERYVNGVVPIGPVHDSLGRLLLGPDGVPVVDAPTVQEGELCISGPQMFTGYLDPADDRGRFLEHGGQRWYRTGDRVRRHPDGEICYLGRADDQVQVQGWRVELSEVSHALRDLDGVQEAVAVAVPAGGSHELVAFWTGQPLSPAVLARQLAAALPKQMVPRVFHHLDEFPMNANRKIDRTALRERATALLGR